MCVKTIHGQWHTQNRMHKWGQTDTALCPLCSTHPETTVHLLQCPSETAKTTRIAKLLDFRSMLESVETDPKLRNWMMSSLIQYTNGFPITHTPVTNDADLEMVNETYAMQNKLEPRNMFRGLLCTQISDLQARWCNENNHNKRNTMAKWDMSVRKELITIANEIWMNRCKTVHKENKSTVESYTLTSAFDLCHKLKRVPWSLPSASRHLLHRDSTFFKKGSIQDVSSWLCGIQYGVQLKQLKVETKQTYVRGWV